MRLTLQHAGQARGVGAPLLDALFTAQLVEVHAKRHDWRTCAAELAAAAALTPTLTPILDPGMPDLEVPARTLVVSTLARVAGDAARWQGNLSAARDHYMAAEQAVSAVLAGGALRSGAGGDRNGDGGDLGGRSRAGGGGGVGQSQRGRRRAAGPAASSLAQEPQAGSIGTCGGRLAWALRGALARARLGRAKCAAAAGEPDVAAGLAGQALAALAPPKADPSAALSANTASAALELATLDLAALDLADDNACAGLRDAPVAAAAVLVFQAALLLPAGPGSACDARSSGRQRAATDRRSPQPGLITRADERTSRSSAPVQLWGCSPGMGLRHPVGYVQGSVSPSGNTAPARALGRGAGRVRRGRGRKTGGGRQAGAACAELGTEAKGRSAVPAADARLQLLLRALAAGGGAPLLARCFPSCCSS